MVKEPFPEEVTFAMNAEQLQEDLRKSVLIGGNNMGLAVRLEACGKQTIMKLSV